MIQEMYSSLKENIKVKTTNPFLGSLIIVWIYENWKLIITFFQMDSKLTLTQKINLLHQYLNPTAFSINMVKCILITLLVLIITYSLLNLSRLIVNFYEKIVTPLVYKITDKSSIVLKSDYEALFNQIDLVEKKYINERNERIKFQQELSSLEKDLFELKISKKETLSDTKSSDKKIISGSYSVGEMLSIYNKIKSKKLTEHFEKTLKDVLIDTWIDNDEGLKYYITLDLFNLQAGSTGTSSSVKLFLTEKGKAFREYYVENYM